MIYFDLRCRNFIAGMTYSANKFSNFVVVVYLLELRTDGWARFLWYIELDYWARFLLNLNFRCLWKISKGFPFLLDDWSVCSLSYAVAAIKFCLTCRWSQFSCDFPCQNLLHDMTWKVLTFSILLVLYIYYNIIKFNSREQTTELDL